MTSISPTRNQQFWNNISATPADFNLSAGAFGITLHASAWGSAVLQRLLPDGSTYVAVSTISADGYVEVHVPAGQYRLSLTGVTGLVGDLAMIANGAAYGRR